MKQLIPGQLLFINRSKEFITELQETRFQFLLNSQKSKKGKRKGLENGPREPKVKKPYIKKKKKTAEELFGELLQQALVKKGV